MIIRARLKASFHLLVIHSRHPALDAGSIPSRHPRLITPPVIPHLMRDLSPLVIPHLMRDPDKTTGFPFLRE